MMCLPKGQVAELDMTETRFERKSYNANTAVSITTCCLRRYELNLKHKEEVMKLLLPYPKLKFLIIFTFRMALLCRALQTNSITERKKRGSKDQLHTAGFDPHSPSTLQLFLLLTLFQPHLPSAPSAWEALSCLRTFALAVSSPEMFFLQLPTRLALS